MNSLLPIHPAQYLAKCKATEVKTTIEAMWNTRYPACPVLEPEFVGLTFGQVAIFRQVQAAASGCSIAFDKMVDRMVGRPMQVNQNLNVNKSYKDFLLEIAREEGIIDVESGLATTGPEGNPQSLE